MTSNVPYAHPWMANSGSGAKQEMLGEIGAASIEELFEQIPQDHHRSKPLDLPPALVSESELRRHLVKTLAANQDCENIPEFPRRGLLAASRSRRRRRDRGAHRVSDPGLGLAAIRSWPQPGLVRVQQPARRVAADGCCSASGLQLGLRHRTCHPHGLEDYRTPSGGSSGALRSGDGCRLSGPTASRRK